MCQSLIQYSCPVKPATFAKSPSNHFITLIMKCELLLTSRGMFCV